MTVELDDPAADVAAIPGATEVRFEGGRWTFDVEQAGLDAAMRALAAWGVRSIECRPPSLEQMFLRLYEIEGTTAP
ncbi:MAG: hypothetical protein R2715_01820 [Ilumatobacteraceae bacterium]